jgi:hypothetical protein
MSGQSGSPLAVGMLLLGIVSLLLLVVPYPQNRLESLPSTAS